MRALGPRKSTAHCTRRSPGFRQWTRVRFPPPPPRPLPRCQRPARSRSRGAGPCSCRCVEFRMPPTAPHVPDDERIGDRDLAQWRTRTGRSFVDLVARPGRGSRPGVALEPGQPGAGRHRARRRGRRARRHRAGRRGLRAGRRERRRWPRSTSRCSTPPSARARRRSEEWVTRLHRPRRHHRDAGDRGRRRHRARAEAPLVAAGAADGHRGGRLGAHHGARQGPQRAGPPAAGPGGTAVRDLAVVPVGAHPQRHRRARRSRPTW